MNVWRFFNWPLFYFKVAKQNFTLFRCKNNYNIPVIIRLFVVLVYFCKYCEEVVKCVISCLLRTSYVKKYLPTSSRQYLKKSTTVPEMLKQRKIVVDILFDFLIAYRGSTRQWACIKTAFIPKWHSDERCSMVLRPSLQGWKIHCWVGFSTESMLTTIINKLILYNKLIKKSLTIMFFLLYKIFYLSV